MRTHRSEESLSSAFRDTMAGVCAPVAVVTCMDGERPHGTTVSAFSSLSLAPPMVLVALNRRSAVLALIRTDGRFGVNVLAHDQQAVAATFARKGADKFRGVSWMLVHGVPRIGGAVGWLACELARLVAGGDHLVVMGRVVDAEATPTSPLTYHARAFGTHTPLPTS